MDFEFSEAQGEIREQTRRFLSDRSSSRIVRRVLDGDATAGRALWGEMAELGLLGIAIPEEHGGSGAGPLELCVVAEEIGRALAPVPLSSAIYLAADLVMREGTKAQKNKYLPGIAAGERIGCLAFVRGPGDPGPQAASVAASAAGALDGEAWPVLDGMVADFCIVLAREEDGAPSLVLVELAASGVERTALRSLDPTRSQARIALRGVEGDRLGPKGAGWTLLDGALQRAAVLVAFEQIGGAEKALETARDYALERTAFGRPIGSFQAIKHKLVDMYVALVLARSNAYFGAWALSTDPASLSKAAATARISATDAYQLCARENIQVHGGMGFTWDSDCHLHFRRSQLLAVSLGGPAFWADRLVGELQREAMEAVAA